MTTKTHVSCFINYIVQPSLSTAIQITCSYVNQSRTEQGKDPCGVKVHCNLFCYCVRIGSTEPMRGKVCVGKICARVNTVVLIHACFVR